MTRCSVAPFLSRAGHLMREVKPTMDPRLFPYSTIYFKKARAVTGLKATGLTKFATENMFGRCVYEFVRGIAR